LATYRCDKFTDLQVSNYSNGSQNIRRKTQRHVASYKARSVPLLPHIGFAATTFRRVMVCFLVLGINCDSNSRCVAWGNPQQTMLILSSHARVSLYPERLSLGRSDATFLITKWHRRFTLFTFLFRDLETKAPSTRTFLLRLRPEDSDHL
jgi:hypothetical protein